MAIQQNKKQSDLEKRLQLLRRQVYGQESVVSSKYHVARDEKALGNTHTTNSASDLTYLHQDLLKILIFASFAIGGQAILFLLVRNNVFTLNFF